jgi:heptosyltransferase III
MIRRNALIFQSGGLGDFVLTWPLGLALGRLYPQSRIIYVSQASKGELAAAALGLDWRDAESSWSGLYSNPSGLSDKTLKTVIESHCVYTFIAGAGDAFCRNVAMLSPEAAVVPLRLAPTVDFRGHVSEYLVQQMSSQPIVGAAVGQILASIGKRGLGAAARAGGPILVHPGSGGREKCWPVERFVQLIEKLAVRGAAVKVLLGEVEMERFPAGEIRQLESAAAVVRPAKYVDLYNECIASAGFIGNDSGPAHLAGILGLPTLALFGPSDSGVWRPLGPQVAVLQHSRLPDLGADEVALAWQRLMEMGK